MATTVAMRSSGRHGCNSYHLVLTLRKGLVVDSQEYLDAISSALESYAQVYRHEK